MSKLTTYALAKKDPAMAIAVETERIERKLEQKIKDEMRDTILSDSKFMSALLQSVISEVHKIKRGDDGYTPEAGKDFFTKAQVNSIITYIQERIRIPKDGKDADEESIKNTVIKNVLKEIKQPENGITPKAGIDYPTEDQVKSLIMTEIAYLFSIKPKDKTGISKDEVNQLIGKIQQKIDWKQNAQEIARAIESIKVEKEKLDYNALKNKPDIPSDSNIENRMRGIMRGGGDRIRVYELTGTGATKTFTVPIHKRALLVISTDFPILLKSTVDFTTSGTTLTMTDAVPIPSSGASIAFLYVE